MHTAMERDLQRCQLELEASLKATKELLQAIAKRSDSQDKKQKKTHMAALQPRGRANSNRTWSLSKYKDKSTNLGRLQKSQPQQHYPMDSLSTN